MICPKCGSNSVNIQSINQVHLRNVHHGCLWWLIIGFWWIPIKWTVFTLPAFIFKIFGHSKQKAVNRIKTVCVCQNCGHEWNT